MAVESSGTGIGSTRSDFRWVISRQRQRVRLSHGMHEALDSILLANTEQKQKPQSQTKPDNHLLGRQSLRACWKLTYVCYCSMSNNES